MVSFFFSEKREEVRDGRKYSELEEVKRNIKKERAKKDQGRTSILADGMKDSSR
jgi:hypothetical protein